jgi:CheY-like chemotaxis protein
VTGRVRAARLSFTKAHLTKSLNPQITNSPIHQFTKSSDCLQIRVGPPFPANGRVRAVTGIDACFVAKRKEHGPDRAHERGVVAAWQVGSPDAAGKERIANEQVQSALAGTPYLEAHAARTMPRSVVHTHLVLAKGNLLVGTVVAVDRGQVGIDIETKQQSLFDSLFVEKLVVAMQMNGRVQRALGDAHARDMVHMRVCEQDVRDGNAFLGDELEQPVDFVTGINQHALARARAGDDEAVFVERGDGLSLDYDHPVILAILDDLLFTSKIRSVAQHAGTTVTFARTSRSALEQMRAAKPSLVIFDLNNPRTDPIGTVLAMKADAGLASIPTVGFVSHVDAATINEARAAGVGAVLARSAFVTRLPEILSGQSNGG